VTIETRILFELWILQVRDKYGKITAPHNDLNIVNELMLGIKGKNPAVILPLRQQIFCGKYQCFRAPAMLVFYADIALSFHSFSRARRHMVTRPEP
jgi:hypothetical protein